MYVPVIALLLRSSHFHTVGNDVKRVGDEDDDNDYDINDDENHDENDELVVL